MILVNVETDGTITLDEFCNDSNVIKRITKNDSNIDGLYDECVKDFTVEKWNAYINSILDKARSMGYTIIVNK